MRLRSYRAAAAICALLIPAILLPTSSGSERYSGNDPDRLLRGFSRAAGEIQWKWETKMRAIPSPERLREHMSRLSAEPHHVGSRHGRANAVHMAEQFRSWGLDAHIEEFDVLFPTPRERRVELVAPTHFVAQLREPAIPEDRYTGQDNQLPTYNVFSADGDVTGELVYVNYGIPSDYEVLDKLGIDVRGKIVIARYGGSWRGIKPKVAHERGAIGCLIYSDPRDDGYYQGPVYPEGAYRPEHGVQRGSVVDLPVRPGDPLTPGYGAVKGAPRISPGESDVLMKIPVQPISWGDALPLLKALSGHVAPESWRGALPITYRTGPGPARVRLKLEFDWSTHTAYNVIARIEGAVHPDEWIIIGNHHDAWVNGATDPISGMATVLEIGRALGELAREGWKPRRSILLCAWDAEEPGLLGSTEWVETHAEALGGKAVAYINSDSTGRGWINVGGSHSLERLVNEVARDVHDPVRGKSLLEALRERRIEQARSEADLNDLKTRGDLRIGALGSGSDYTPFLQHLGIASLNTGFGGESGGGVYHSIYDTFTWYTRYSDTTFEYGRALAQFNGTLLMRLAGAEVLPFEFVNLAETIGGYVAEVEALASRGDWSPRPDLGPLRAAAATLDESARKYEAALDMAAARGFDGTGSLAALNNLLYTSERRLITERGLPRRPWYRHQIYAPGLFTGYGVKTLPGVREALEQGSRNELEPQIAATSKVLLALSRQIDSATKTLLGDRPGE